MSKKRVLVADDEMLSREFLAEALRAAGFEVDEAETGGEAATLFEARRHDMVFSDLRMPGGDGVALLKRVKAAAPDVPVVLVTAFGSVETAVKAMHLGAEDFIMKPVAIEHLELVLDRLAERDRLRRENRVLRAVVAEKSSETLDVIGCHAAWKRCIEVAERVARTRATVLVRGESGSGKEVIATILHRQSDRRSGPFIRTNCAVLQETLLSSELFGHEKGAFTGAHVRKEGRFELAQGGTLFLDEIGEISPDIQAKLLRVLETGEFERVGGKETLKVDVRVVCATNRRLEEMIARGSFREDLFYRLNVVPIEVPALRLRGDDAVLLAEHFVRRYAREFGSTPKTLTDGAKREILSYPWPGNVRELANVVQRTVLLATEDAISAADLGLTRPAECGEPAKLVGRTIADVERSLILGTLDRTHGNKTHAAQILGVTARTLSNKMKVYRAAGLPSRLSGALVS
jgi:DNA-binding NtrC family response regulator